MSEEKKTFEVTTPVGRLINHALFERDQFDDKAKFKYNIEMAFETGDVTGEGSEDEPTLEDVLWEAAEHFWGEGSGNEFLEGQIRSPLLDGDKLKKKREANGKVGDAYESLTVVRAGTIFNRDGFEGPGGAVVWDENVKAVMPVDRGKVYQGSMGCALLTVGSYIDTDPRTDEEIKCLMFYLKAYQFTGDGDKLAAMSDTAGAFKKVGKAAKGRSKRSG